MNSRRVPEKDNGAMKLLEYGVLLVILRFTEIYIEEVELLLILLS